MKKIFVIVVTFLFLCVGFTSCGSHERCAAYGKINKTGNGKVVAVQSQKPA